MATDLSIALPGSKARTHPGLYEWVKRIMDILLSAVFVLFLAPLIATISVLIAAASGPPILFRQKRLEKGGGVFSILKFRTMTQDAPETLRNDPKLRELYLSNHFKIPADLDYRITRPGRLLRKTGLDELPQLINVLKGEMSLVGPRPIVPVEIARYEGHEQEFLSVKPGITGLWQVHGRGRASDDGRVALDLSYIARRSLWLDFGILLKTVSVLVGQDGSG